MSARPDSALLPCDHAEPDFCGGGALSCERCPQDEPERWGGAGGGEALGDADDERLPNEPNDEFFDDVDRLLLVGLDFWEENPLLYELELDRELELDDGFAAAVSVVAAGSSKASSNMI
ncbi:hypothetical protein [Massilia genomosp. 1]|uniref:Uncharacterized protein n=1 Tax=Massilia genomosp. 1 TaxID=2609280 RepID=A0ABX0MRA9_9BURK|nr:hypothetical protein [Massilia genomosp. 1]NHZ65282.1 hypothetical protein [Massilia genomosp. 1]